MKINAARKLSAACYTVAVICLLMRLFIPLAAVYHTFLTCVMFGTIAVGFLVCFLYCRCPHCGRVQRPQIRDYDTCPFCGKRLV